MPKAGGDLVFRSPRIWADLGMLIVVLPIGVAALAFLLAFPAVPLVLWLGFDPDDRTLIKWCVIAAIALVLVAVRHKFFWSITLEQDAIRVGKVWPRRVRYDRVRFIKSGRDFDPTGEITLEASWVTPLSFAIGWLREYRLFLRYDDAEHALRELHARSPNAAAVDARGVFFPPRNREASRLSYADFRAVRSLAIRATAASVLSVLDWVQLVISPGSDPYLTAVLIALLVAFVGYAVYAARRIRQITSAPERALPE